MGVVVLVALCLVLLGAIAAIVPVHRPPLSSWSFVVGGIAGELAGQLLVVDLAAAFALDATGWPGGPFGDAAVAVAACGVLCYGVVVTDALAARSVVRRAAGDTARAQSAGRARPAWLAPWRTALAVPIRGRAVRVVRDVPYLDDGTKAHTLDIYLPRGHVETAPVMVYVHGGAWVIGSSRGQALPMLYELAASGWVCVSINYRLSPAATWPDHIADVKRAIAWVREHAGKYGASPETMLAISGGSAGGHLASLAALTPNDPAFQVGFEGADTHVDACVSLYGVLDMTPDAPTQGPEGRALASLLADKVIKQRLADARAVYEAASPIHRITRDAPPFMVLHGTHDTLVPVAVARAFVARLREVSAAPVAYVELPGAQHAFDLACSVRCTATTRGITTFLDALVAGRRAARRVP